MSQFVHKDQDTDNIECSVSVRLWSIPGCHELLASLGMVLFSNFNGGLSLCVFENVILFNWN